MEDLIVKNVDVMGDSIMAAQDLSGIIWVGVRWMCDALDMTEGQMKRQIKNIQNDMLLAASGSNQILNKGSGEREVFCIKLDYVPIWLAKISITQKTREERPDFAQKLLNYQLKAKDILAAAFLPKQSGESGDLRKQIQVIAKGTDELYQRVDAVDGKVDEVKAEIESLRDELPLFPSEADKIKEAVNKRVVSLLGGKESNAYKDDGVRRKVFINCYQTLKGNFEVGKYTEIKRKYRHEARKIAEKYEPPFFLAEQIETANAQQRLDV